MKALTQNNINIWLWLTGIFLIAVLSGCSNTKRLSDHQSLLVNNTIVINEENLLDKTEMKAELKKLARQQTNKKFLNLWRFRLSVFNMASRKDEVYYDQNRPYADTTGGKFNQWLKEKVGEPPILFDSSLMKSSQVRMEQHLFNNGYFNSEVTSDYAIKKKKAKVNYYVTPNDQYFLRNVDWKAEDPIIGKIVTNTKDQTLVKKGDPYLSKVLDNERTRITNNIQEEGFFTFNREYIIVEIDTFLKGNLADISYTVKDPPDSTGHKIYYIGNIEFDLKVPASRLKKIDLTKLDTTMIRDIYTLLPEKTLKPRPIVRSIFFDEDSLYRKSEYNATLKRLNSLGVFRSVNVKFEPYLVAIDEGVLDTKISATMRKKQAFSIENEWSTDAEQSLGIELSTAYINRNILNRANRFEFNLSGGLEFQLKRNDASEENLSVLNTVELRSNFKLKFPEIILPYKRKKLALPVKNEQSSAINLAYEFERRLGFYTIHEGSISLQNDWYVGKRDNRIKHLVEVFSLGLVAPIENSFSVEFLETLNNFPSLKRSFEPQFIAKLIDYSFIYNGQSKTERHSVYFKGTAKGAGNLLHAIAIPLNKENTRPFQLFNIDYSQFFKFESDLRYYLNLRNGNVLATRFFAGVGVPYGNVDVLPFTEQFYGGGNQSLRAWGYRGLGPGGFDTRTLTGLPDQAGDIKIELNTEFRFTIYKFFKAALFVDAGNVWLIRKDLERPDAEFRITRSDGSMNSFIDEFAMNLGFGVRLDFNFFVVRLDAALPIRDPAFDDGERWQFDKIDLSNKSDYRQRMGLIIAIGYPF